VINAENNSKENVYIQSATLNGKPYDLNWIKHADIANGGVLSFKMGNTPNKLRGTTADDRPFSVSR
jgi:putative alpha-1,2-mannosidase